MNENLAASAAAFVQQAEGQEAVGGTECHFLVCLGEDMCTDKMANDWWSDSACSENGS